jgi:hypothetical protein
MADLRSTLRAEKWLLAIVGLAIAVRVAAILWLSDTVPFSDGAYYELAARKLLANWRFFFDREQVEYYGKLGWWPPLYPAFISLVYRVAGVNHRIIPWAQVLLGALVCGFVQRIGRRAGGPMVGNVAASLVALDPTYVFATNLFASENLYAAWFAGGLWLAGKPWAQRRFPIGAGIAFGLGALTRAIGIGVPLVVALARWRAFPSRRSWARASAWLVVSSILTIAPWTLRNMLVTGSPALVCFGGGLNFYFGHNEVQLGYRDLETTPMSHLATQAAIDREGYRLGLQCLAGNPFGFLTRGVRKLGALFGPPGYAPHDNSAILLPEGWENDPEKSRVANELRARQRAKNYWLDGLFTQLATAHSYLLLLGAIVAVARARRHLPPELQACAWLVVYWIGAHVMFWAQPRFRYPAEIPLALLAAFAVTLFLPGRRAASQEFSIGPSG